jgi:hypothetical protein
MTITEEGLREGGVCESLSGCWVHAVFLPRGVTVPEHVHCTKVPRRRRQSRVSVMTREVGGGCEHREHAVCVMNPPCNHANTHSSIQRQRSP